MVPEIRVQSCNQAPVNAGGMYVLYWMVAFRRTNWNFSLERAVEWAMELNKPLVIFEALRQGHPWASDRVFRFVLDGMAENMRRLRSKNAFYFPFVEPKPGAGGGLLAALAKRACVVVTDDFPCFVVPNMVEDAVRRLKVRLEKIDSNGLLPMRAASEVFKKVLDFRRFLHHALPFYLSEFIKPDPLVGRTLPKLGNLPAEIEQRWPPTNPKLLDEERFDLYQFPIDHSVPVLALQGGPQAGERTLNSFLEYRLQRFAERSTNPDKESTSGLSPYLHFGHLSVHQVFSQLVEREGWSLGQLSPQVTGSPRGWWGMSRNAEAFLDQLITWRELGFNFCWRRPDYDQYESLPDWAKKTLAKHETDPREHIYSLEKFEKAQTHDTLWNAAQTQLVREGRIHPYLRMLWGKKIVEWTTSPQEALAIMIELNNKHAIDGRNPNSYAGIFWTLGRYDRPWAPEQPILGKVRGPSSESNVRKMKVRKYIEKYDSHSLALF
ncbi:MAG: deoxyribodipyrimidine photolyase [bacterium]